MNGCSCSSINRHKSAPAFWWIDRCQGRFRKWAVAAAFGDNLPKAALALAQNISLGEDHVSALQQLGLLLNYNAYGERIEDLHIAPDALYRALHEFVDPFDFIACSAQYQLLHDGYHLDAARMDALTPEWQSACGTIFVLPLEPWACRISGVFANRQIASEAHLACAVLTEKSDGSFLVSVRSSDPISRSSQRPVRALSRRRRQTRGGRNKRLGRHTTSINSLPVFLPILRQPGPAPLMEETMEAKIKSPGLIVPQQRGSRPRPVLMIPLRRCGSHALRLRLNFSPQFYSPYPLHIVDFMPIVPLYGDLANDKAYFRLVVDVVGLQAASMVKWSDVVFDPVDIFDSICREPRSVHSGRMGNAAARRRTK